MWPSPDPRSRSRSLTFRSSENCTFLRLPPPLFWRGAHNWWVITIDLVYSFWELYVWISPQWAVTWLRISRNVDITRIHCVLSPRCTVRTPIVGVIDGVHIGTTWRIRLNRRVRRRWGLMPHYVDHLFIIVVEETRWTLIAHNSVTHAKFCGNSSTCSTENLFNFFTK